MLGEQKGLLLSCTKCSITGFRKYIGEGERDGGYTRWDKFEPVPEGWLQETEFGYLCPNCAKTFKTLMTEFFGDNTVEKWRT